MSKRGSGETNLSDHDGQQPFVAPGVPGDAAARAAAYAQGMSARRGGVLPTKTQPLRGEPAAFPHLGGRPQAEGPSMTLAQHAAAERPQLAAPAHTGGIVQRDGAPAAARLDIRPTDVLPEPATRDPGFLQGQGAMYASAQPHLAAKYGVMRNGVFLAPQALSLQTQPGAPAAAGGQKRSLSAASLQDLETLSALQQQQKSALPTDQESVRASTESSAGAAAQLANAPGNRDVTPITEDAKKKLESAISGMDEFQFNEYRNALLKDLLNNDEQRKLIEDRLDELRIEDLLNHGVIRQKIRISDRFSMTLQSFDGQLDLALKRIIMEESRSLDVTERYLLDKYSFFGVCAGLHAINDKVFPDFRDTNGDFNDDLFTAKFNKVIKLPLHLLASVGVNLFWFDQRVRRLVRAEKLGNG